MGTTERLQEFLSIYDMPEFLKPWIDRFFEDIEIELMMNLANKPLTRKEINLAYT